VLAGVLASAHREVAAGDYLCPMAVLISHMSACPWALSPAARVRAFSAPPLWVALARGT
jgi:hypothetical protein